MFLFFIALRQLPAQKLSLDSLRNELHTAPDDTSKVNLLRMLTGILLNSDPPAARQYARQGIQLGLRSGFDKGVAGCYLNLAVAYNADSKIDSFLIFTDSALVWSQKVGDNNRLALVYLNRADAYMQVRNLKQSLLDCDTALYYAELSNNDDRRARIYQTMGTIYFTQEKYSDSKPFYEKASRLYHVANNHKMYAIMLNNLGNLHKRGLQFDSAFSYYQDAIAYAQNAGDEISLSLYYNNISSMYHAAQQYPKAEEAAVKALQHANRQNNDVEKASAYNNLAIGYLNQSRPAKALEMALKAYAINNEYELIEEQYETANILADAYAALGNFEASSRYLRTARDINDSLLRKKYDDQIAYLQTSFKVAEKNNEISQLTKDKAIQEQNLMRHRLLIAGALLLSFLAVAAVFMLVSRQQLKQRMKELELRNEIASDLHDEVGSSLSSIHLLSEMGNSEKSNPLLQKDVLQKVSNYSRETMDKMSDIVWMIKQKTNPEEKALEERMKHFFYDIAKSKNMRSLFLLEAGVLLRLDMHQYKALYLVFKEAVNNAVKYSGATEITVQIGQKNNGIHMQVTDNGTGFDKRHRTTGNGLQNMQTRAAKWNGYTDISSEVNKGTQVTFFMPV